MPADAGSSGFVASGALGVCDRAACRVRPTVRYCSDKTNDAQATETHSAKNIRTGRRRLRVGRGGGLGYASAGVSPLSLSSKVNASSPASYRSSAVGGALLGLATWAGGDADAVLA